MWKSIEIHDAINLKNEMILYDLGYVINSKDDTFGDISEEDTIQDDTKF